MPAKRKSQSPIVPIGMSTKHMKRKKPINLEYIKTIDPLTSNQEEFFRSYKNDQNLQIVVMLITNVNFHQNFLHRFDCIKIYEQAYVLHF